MERQAGLYACLYTCVRAVPYPKHLLHRHREYLMEAKRVAVPIFYSAVASALILILQFSLGKFWEPITLVAAAGLPFTLGLGWVMRVRLIRRHRLPQLTAA